jgi:hypothetical protein
MGYARPALEGRPCYYQSGKMAASRQPSRSGPGKLPDPRRLTLQPPAISIAPLAGAAKRLNRLLLRQTFDSRRSSMVSLQAPNQIIHS